MIQSTPTIPFRRRLAFRLSVVIVLQITLVSSLFFTVWNLAPYWPFSQLQRERFMETVLSPGTPFGREVRDVLGDARLSAAQRQAQLTPLLAIRLKGSTPADASQQAAALLTEIEQSRQGVSPIFTLAWVVFPTLVLALWLRQRIVKPIPALMVAADRLTAGDLSIRVPLTKQLERSGDELALLIQRFNMMAKTLEKLERERK